MSITRSPPRLGPSARRPGPGGTRSTRGSPRPDGARRRARRGSGSAPPRSARTDGPYGVARPKAATIARSAGVRAVRAAAVAPSVRIDSDVTTQPLSNGSSSRTRSRGNASVTSLVATCTTASWTSSAATSSLSACPVATHPPTVPCARSVLGCSRRAASRTTSGTSSLSTSSLQRHHRPDPEHVAGLGPEGRRDGAPAGPPSRPVAADEPPLSRVPPASTTAPGRSSSSNASAMVAGRQYADAVTMHARLLSSRSARPGAKVRSGCRSAPGPSPALAQPIVSAMTAFWPCRRFSAWS